MHQVTHSQGLLHLNLVFQISTEKSTNSIYLKELKIMYENYRQKHSDILKLRHRRKSFWEIDYILLSKATSEQMTFVSRV